MILTDEQAQQVKATIAIADTLRGRFQLQFDGVSVIYNPALQLNPQLVIVHTFATEHFDTAREFMRQYGIDA